MNIVDKYREKLRYDEKTVRDKLAMEYMTGCKVILDVGCGEGRFIACDPQRIVGIDHNKKSLDLCRKKNYIVYYGEVTQLPFDDHAFDAVHCAHTIEHLLPDDAYRLLCEINRILKPNGIFCLRTPLLYDGFYNDFTHIKPYNPNAVMHYLGSGSQRTFDDMGCVYEKIALNYRKRQFFADLYETKYWFIASFFSILYRWGFSNGKKTAYMLVLRKKS